MRAARAHLAAVVDDQGRGIGLVTMADVLKELVGQGRG
jgi:CBS domain containing-hemolysin-like protein